MMQYKPPVLLFYELSIDFYTRPRKISKWKSDEIISETPIIDSHWPLDNFCASI